MDYLNAQVVLEPIILGDLVIEEDESNPQASTQFLETFRRNQTQTVQGPNEQSGALVLIRTNGLLRRNFIFPAIIPNLSPSRGPPIPLHPGILPHGPGPSSYTPFLSNEMRPSGDIMTERNYNSGSACKCPTPGTKPLNPCEDCKSREYYEWSWDKDSSDTTAVFQNSDRDVIFNPGFSVGTVGVRGTTPLKDGWHHFWEIEMSSDVYGTDMMIGVGTDKIDLRQHSHSFVSLIGLTEQSWGLSYCGNLQHDGKIQNYTTNFGQHTVIGVHLDLWSGSLEFYVNRKPLGKAFTGLKGKVLYPMISSTAARSGMNLVFCRSYLPSLQLQTMLSIGKSMKLPDNISIFKALPDNIIPPGLKTWMKNNFWWITSTQERLKKAAKTDKKQKALGSEAAGSSQITRRGRKTKKCDESGMEGTLSHLGVTTRSMAARRTFMPTNPIFAPAPSSDDPIPAKSPRVSEPRGGPVTRSSSPSVRVEDTSVIAATEESHASTSSASSKRMCLRSSKK